ncbi:MAG: hypothetical protein LJE63_01480 [Desulfobacteraceae bacterium]|nr:hypothetical protein [Desulfobacteraceae bacterium]
MSPRPACLMLCLLVALTGCADLSPLFRKAPVGGGPTPPPAEVSAPIPFDARALDYEKNGDLQMALFFWKVVSRLNPEDKEVAGRIESLRIAIQRESQQHYEKGVSLFHQGLRREAQIEFLTALRQNPDHREALAFLKERIHGERFLSHEVADGETFATIGEKLYGDSQMGLLIASLLGVAPTARPTPGTALLLPRDVEKPKAPALKIDQELAAARQLLAQEKFAAAADLMDKVLQQEPANSDARNLADQAHFENGKRLHLAQRYREALAAFKQVSPGYRDTDAFLAVIRQQLENEAETHYRRGVKHFVDEDLAQAIAEWQQTLELNPDHQKAAQDIENARELLKKLKKVEQQPAAADR